MAARNPHNAVRLELAEGGDERYARVAALVAEWTADGALAREELDTLYVYEQIFSEAGETFTRRALVAAVEAQPWEEGAILPHEYTMSGPKADRLRLLQEETGPLSMQVLFSGGAGERKARIRAKDFMPDNYASATAIKAAGFVNKAGWRPRASDT